jgi:adenine deaminase
VCSAARAPPRRVTANFREVRNVDNTIESFVKAIPKTETHLHLEGALPYRVLHEHNPERFPADPEFRRPDFRHPDFIHFEETLGRHSLRWFTSVQRYHEGARHIFAGLAAQNVRYVETSVHLGMIEFFRLDPGEWIAAIKSAAPAGLEVKVIGGLARDSYSETLQPLIERLHRWDELDGIDLHGREWLDLEDWAPPVWRRCKAAGKIIKAHAGEFGGPDKVREAIDVLGVERIQHGVRAIEDPALVERIAELGLVLDVCPISNERLKVVPSLEAHCIRNLVEAGVVCTVNTDDPLVFGNTLEQEYLSLAERLHFSVGELAALARNGFRTARMDARTRDAHLAEIDRLAREASRDER